MSRRTIAKNTLIEIGPGFWNVRSDFKIFANMINIGTHMSIVQLSNGNFVILDTVELDTYLKQQIDTLTQNGNLIEGVVGTHPAHTRSFQNFYTAYPQAAYYGTPKHLRILPDIPWLGCLDDCNIRKKWEPDLEMRITAGGEFTNPQASCNHLMSVFVYHQPSRTLHVDDTINYTDKFRSILKVFGFRHGLMMFHTSIKGAGLHPTSEAPFIFRDWMINILHDWAFENICCAHLGFKIGDAHMAVTALVDKTAPLFTKLSRRNRQTNPLGRLPTYYHANEDLTGDECG